MHTVAGGLGLLFTQLIKVRGATVIGTTSTPAKAAIARVLEPLNSEGVHAIFDGVGKDTCVA